MRVRSTRSARLKRSRIWRVSSDTPTHTSCRMQWPSQWSCSPISVVSGPSSAPSLVVVQGVKPDYSGPYVTGVVPALLGVRPVSWLPEPVGGARASVLLVLDGLGWAAFDRYPECLPELRACAGGPVTTV